MPKLGVDDVSGIGGLFAPDDSVHPDGSVFKGYLDAAQQNLSGGTAGEAPSQSDADSAAAARETAAQRMHQAVQPEGGRKAGAITAWINRQGEALRDDVADLLRHPEYLVSPGELGAPLVGALKPRLSTAVTSREAVTIDRQAMEVQARKGKPISGDPFPTNTRPTAGAGQLMGEPEPIPYDADPDYKFGIRVQNESLRQAADAGYSVVQQPKKTFGRDGKPLLTEAQQRDLGLDPDRKPDALINGRVFDVYGPISETARGVRAGIDKKVNELNQAHRILVNFKGTDVTPNQLRRELEKNPIDNLKEIILIDRNGNFRSFFPF